MPSELVLMRRVAFAETDLAGVMHFSNYLRWMEDLEHAFWRGLGRSVHIREGASAISWPRVAVKCEYFAPLHFENEVEMRLQLSKIGAKSLTFDVEFRREGVRVAAGQTTCVCAALGGGSFRAMEIPKDIRELLEKR